MKTNSECKLDRLLTILHPQVFTCLPQPREPQDQSLAKNHSQTGEAQSQKLHLQPGLQYWKNQNSEWHSYQYSNRWTLQQIALENHLHLSHYVSTSPVCEVGEKTFLLFYNVQDISASFMSLSVHYLRLFWKFFYNPGG